MYLRRRYMSWVFISQRREKIAGDAGLGPPHLSIVYVLHMWNPRLLHLNVDVQAVQKVYPPMWEDRSFWHLSS